MVPLLLFFVNFWTFVSVFVMLRINALLIESPIIMLIMLDIIMKKMIMNTHHQFVT